MAVGDVADYLATLPDAERTAVGRVYDVAREVVPEAVEGTSYAMAALLYRGKGLVASVAGRRFLSIYPFSGSVIMALGEPLRAFETTKGSIHFSADHQLDDALLRRLVEVRRAEIDAVSSR